MANSDLKQQYPLFKYTKKMAKICKPLVDKIPISSFHSGKIYKDGWTLLSNSLEFSEYCLRKEYFNVEINYYRSGYYVENYELWSAFDMPRLRKEEKTYLDDLVRLNHAFGISFYEHFEDHVITHHFGISHRIPKPQELLSKNVSLFKQFIMYFKENLHKDKNLLACYNNKILVDPSKLVPISQDYSSPQNPFNIHKYYFGGDFKNIYFTRSEMDVLKHFYRGNSIKKIAEILDLSDRTVESHMNNLKKKTDSKSAFELRQKLFNNPLFSLIV
ncbi:MAG: helix-turn-helix transcriptional regulator [Gammaproteobacteria bacterium]|nr:helix-turn-helix transcriptional regulator [Gammaproteobacteria bacterium]